MLAQNTAKSPEETKRMMNELVVRSNNVEDISGEAVAVTHGKSILLTFMDPVTRPHTAAFQGKTKGTDAVGEFSKSGWSCRIRTRRVDWEDANNLNALGKSGCYVCGTKEHFARECQAKGKGEKRQKQFQRRFRQRCFVEFRQRQRLGRREERVERRKMAVEMQR